MTNGEKIKEIFPNIIKYGNILIDDTGALQKNILFDDTWWNAEYQEIPTGSTTKNDLDDCISQFSAKQVVRNHYCGIPSKVYSKLMVELDNLPSVTPIRPKGHWIDHSDEGYVECPKCGSATNCDDNISDLHFCFSCGAEMRGSEE